MRYIFAYKTNYHLNSSLLRFPETIAELSLSAESRLLFTSTYCITGIPGLLNLDLAVRDGRGTILEEGTFKQVDKMERKYGVTFQRDSK